MREHTFFLRAVTKLQVLKASPRHYNLLFPTEEMKVAQIDELGPPVEITNCFSCTFLVKCNSQEL